MSTTTIDSFVLELGIDPSKFTKGQREALDGLRKFQEQALAGGKEIESYQKKGEAFFGAFKRQALAITGALLGGAGIKQFIEQVTSLDAATARTSLTLGASIENLSEWQGAARRAGGSAGSITGTLLGLRNAMEGFLANKNGGEGFLPTLEAFDVSMFDANRNLRNSGEILLDLVESMKARGHEIPRIAAMLRDFPGMNEQSINLIIQGRKAVNALREETRRHGLASRESGEQAKQYQSAIVGLEDSVTHLWRTLVGTLGPGTTTIIDIISDSIKAATVVINAYLHAIGQLPTLARHMIFGPTPDEIKKGEEAEQRSRERMNRLLGQPPTLPTPAPPPPPRPGEGPVLRTYGNTGATPAREPPGPLWGERPSQEPPKPARALQEPPRPAATPLQPEPPRPGPLPPPAGPGMERMRVAQEPPKPPPLQQEPPRPAALRSPVRSSQEPLSGGAVPYLSTKPGAFSGRESPAIMALAQRIQATEPGLQRFTAGNDRFHSGMSSKHNQGLALDFTVRDRAQAAAITERLQKELGKSALVRNEYERPSPFSTGPHIHVEFHNAAAAHRYTAGGIRPGAAQAVPPAGATTNDASRTTTVTNTTNISGTTIQTQATDAEGIAGSIDQWLQRMSVAAPADYGQR